jgi:hypothetical protein
MRRAMAETKSEQRDRERGYRTVAWNGIQERYECLGCPYDTDDESLMRAHQAAPHPQGG